MATRIKTKAAAYVCASREQAQSDIASLASAALQHKDPALAKLDADRAKAAPMPAEVREKLNRLKKGA